MVNTIRHRWWLLLLLVVTAWVVSGCAASPTADDSPAASSSVQAPPATATIPTEVAAAPAGEGASASAAGTYQGLAAGFTEEGFPFVGDPDAPVTLEEYSDFLCPFCGRHFEQTVPALMEQYVQTGQVKIVRW